MCVLYRSIEHIFRKFIFREVKELKDIDIKRKSLNNIRYADDTGLMIDGKSFQKIVNEVKYYSSIGKLKQNLGVDVSIRKIYFVK